MSDLNAPHAKAEAILAGGLFTLPFWSGLLQEASWMAGIIASFCGAIIGIYTVYRIIRGKGSPPLVALMWIVALSSFPVQAHDPNHPEFNDWFAAQVTPDNRHFSCCDKSDVHILDDIEVRIVAGEYEVLTSDGWLRFPNTGQGNVGNTVLGPVGNPT